MSIQLAGKSLPRNARIFSAIQPTGMFHLGNYFGAVRVWKDLTEKCHRDSTLIFATADLHAITVPQNPAELHQNRRSAIASIIASGVNPERAIIYHQSSVMEHAYLNWILSCVTGMGLLNRMTQWKSKAHIQKFSEAEVGKVKLGLFAYPVLQAADILLYRSTHVPVGEDQGQHLELCRTVAENFNKLVDHDYFAKPTTLFAPIKKISSLKSPEKKMSKSDPDDLSKIFITDDPVDILKKINKATTDSVEGGISHTWQSRPGIANLFAILSACRRVDVADVANDVAHLSKRDLKHLVAEELIRELEEPRKMYNEIVRDEEKLDRLVLSGTEKARAMAHTTVCDVKRLIGLN